MSEIEKKAPKSHSFFLKSLLLILGIAVGYMILEKIWHKTGYFYQQSLTVRGMSQGTVKSNNAVLSFRIWINEKNPNLIYQKMKTNINTAINFLTKQGCSKKEITILQSMSNHPKQNTLGSQNHEGGNAVILIKTDRVDVMHDLSNALVHLGEQGVTIDQLNLRYNYNCTKEKRTDLLKKALWDAKSKAKHLAEEADSKLVKSNSLEEKSLEITSSEPAALQIFDDLMDQRGALYKTLHMTIKTNWGVAPRAD